MRRKPISWNSGAASGPRYHNREVRRRLALDTSPLLFDDAALHQFCPSLSHRRVAVAAMNASLPTILSFPFDGPPAPGTTCEVVPGVLWLRMPLPFALDHINLWLLRDADGWTQIDCGYGDGPT